MKRNVCLAVLAIALAATRANVVADDQHDRMVMEHGSEVMPFDQSRATHMFLPSAAGGVIEIVVRDLNQKQVDLVRSHLLEEAARFARGDYSDPAYIHGAAMPGLSRLSAGASRVTVRYFETPAGAAITFASSDSDVVTAIHDWLAAQARDHNGQ
jgi:hypothetical protein